MGANDKHPTVTLSPTSDPHHFVDADGVSYFIGPNPGDDLREPMYPPLTMPEGATLEEYIEKVRREQPDDAFIRANLVGEGSTIYLAIRTLHEVWIYDQGTGHRFPLPAAYEVLGLYVEEGRAREVYPRP